MKLDLIIKEKMEFTPDQWLGAKEHCDSVGVEFMSYTIVVVDLFRRVSNVTRFIELDPGETPKSAYDEHIIQTKKADDSFKWYELV